MISLNKLAILLNESAISLNELAISVYNVSREAWHRWGGGGGVLNGRVNVLKTN